MLDLMSGFLYDCCRSGNHSGKAFLLGVYYGMMYLFIGVIGSILGSFLNVCIYRLPLGKSIIYPSSHCTHCEHRLGILDLIPIASYLLLRGKCRYCGKAISPRYAIIEFTTGLLFLVCYFVLGYSALCIKAMIFTAFFIVISVIDYDHRLILDKVLFCLAITGVLIEALFPQHGWWDLLQAAVAGGLLFLVIALVSRGGMGMGDVKFAAVLGLYFGFKLSLLIFWLAFFLGGLAGVMALLCGKSRKEALPFGPFLCLAAWIGMLYGEPLIQWYVVNVM